MNEFEGGRIDYIDQAAAAAPARPLKDYSGRTSSKRAPMDVPFLILTIVILVIGVIMVLSASFARSYYSTGDATYYFIRQLSFAALGIVIMLFVSRFHVSFFRRMSLPVMGFALLLLLGWEISYRLHPERFSTDTNRCLDCSRCEEKLCSHKTQLRGYLRKYRTKFFPSRASIRSNGKD